MPAGGKANDSDCTSRGISHGLAISQVQIRLNDPDSSWQRAYPSVVMQLVLQGGEGEGRNCHIRQES